MITLKMILYNNYQPQSRMELAQDIMGFFLDVLKNALTDDLILLDRPIYIY
jgi:hypothetical protein